MNRRLAIMALAFATAVSVLSPDFARAQLASATTIAAGFTVNTPSVNGTVFTASSSSISVKNGSYFLIALASNRTTGYSWSSTKFSPTGVAQSLGSSYMTPTSGLMGAGGTQIFLLKAMKPGMTKLTLTYARPFGSGGGKFQNFTITVTP
jgi:predicted secreted protein